MDIFDKCSDPKSGNFAVLRKDESNYFISPKLEGQVGPRMRYQGDDVIVWSINSYLGMHQNPLYQAAAREALEQYGAESPMGSRLMTGNNELHCRLESSLASFVGQEASNLFANGYLGVMGIIGALVGKSDFIIADRQSHACLVDGMRLAVSRRHFRTYNHNDMENLEKVLISVRKKHRGGLLILTEGLFGMSGEIAHLDKICELKEKYDARLMVDDAHGFGTLGEEGKGAAEYHKVLNKIDVYFSTFAKTFAGIGCFCASTHDVIRYIKYNARSNIYTKSLPMIYANTAYAVLEEIKKNGHLLIKKLHTNATMLQTGLRELGYNLGRANAQITPVYLPNSAKLCMEVVRFLRNEEHIFASPVTYPVIPKNQYLLRLIPTALHTKKDVEETLNSFKKLKIRYPEVVSV